MKILLIKPRTKIDTIIPPIGLGYLAQQLKNKHQVNILDCIKDNISEKKLIDYIKYYTPEVVGIQTYHTDKEIVYNYLSNIKNFSKDTITVIGGPYPSCEEPENIFTFFGKNLDFAFCGESEIGFKKFIEHLNKKNNDYTDIAGLIWRNNNKIIVNNNKFIEDLDSLNPTAWELLNPETYPPAPQGGFLRKFPVAPINISRGCAYKCSFCAGYKIVGHRVRYRSVENVLDEISMLYSKHGIREVHILDDNFTYDREYVTKFCKRIIECGFNIKLSCPNGIRIDTLDEEVLLLMKTAGFYMLHLGIESGSQKILTYMNKNLTLEVIRKKVNMIKNSRIDICGYFIFGYPGEKFRDSIKNIKLAVSLPFIRVMFMNFMPIPGSPIFNLLKKKFKNVNLYKKTFYNVNFSDNEILKIRLKFVQLVGFLIFFLRPKILIRNILSIYNLRHFWYITKRVFRIVINW